MFTQLIIDFRDNIQLGHPVLELPQHLTKRGFCDFARLTHHRDFFVRFNGA